MLKANEEPLPTAESVDHKRILSFEKTEASSLWNTWSRPDGQWWPMMVNPAKYTRVVKHQTSRCWSCAAYLKDIERPDAAIVCEALALGDAVRIDGAGARNKSDSNIKQLLSVSVLGKWREYLRSWTVVTTWGSYDINTLISRVKAAGVGSPWQGGVQVLDSAGVNVHLENQWKSAFNDLSWKVTSYDSIWHRLFDFQLPLADFLKFSFTATGAFDRWITTRSTRLGFLSGGAMCGQFFCVGKAGDTVELCWTATFLQIFKFERKVQKVARNHGRAKSASSVSDWGNVAKDPRREAKWAYSK